MIQKVVWMGMLLVFGWILPSQADYEAGQRAWDAGRHSEALAEWQTAADSGDRRAMMALGQLFSEGLGAPQDYVEAHKWLNLAASRGEAAAVGARDALTVKMTPEQVAEAQTRARTWRAGGDRTASESPPQRAIREAQGLLTGLGYKPGPADGLWNDRTVEAYRAFLRDAGLPAVKTLTPDVLRTMRTMAKRQEAEASQAPAKTIRPDALHRTAQAGDLDGLKAALAAGADVNDRDGRGKTALMYVADQGYTLLVEPLLAADADSNVRAPDGATALFIAVAHGHSEIITKLMKAGADPTIKGSKGKTPVEVAKTRYGDEEAARKNGESAEIIALLKGQTWEQAAIALARSQRTLEAYETYLSNFPRGRHADEAAFAKADLLWTVEAYATYIEAYPSGQHVEKARRLKVALERTPLLTTSSPAGTTTRECPECPEMVVVPAGSFQMGDLSGKGDDDERLVHEVTIDYPFAVGQYEVTFAEWDACRVSGGCSWAYDEGWGRGTRPVINVSWEDAQEYVKWVSRETGKPYRLLSEAEWEYVARAGTETTYWWGGDSWLDDDPHDHANYGTDDCCKGLATGADRWVYTAPVGSFAANAFEVFDTAGNVWEWVEDCWNDNYKGAPTDGRAWTSGDCSQRVVRGGSWRSDPALVRPAVRNRSNPGDRDFSLGFRLARTLTP